MKNIHLLPTDKPSRLFEILQFNFVFDNQNKYSEEYKKLHKYKNKNIYITNDEKIKLNDYITDGYKVWKWKDDSSLLGRKKVILTTDQDLIADGVQAINNEFLEWFVKNSSCEKVEVEIDLHDSQLGNGYSFDRNIYKIIIPQEEPKQETNKTHYLDELPNMDKDVLLKMWDAIMPKLEHKQERVCNCGLKEFEHNVRHPFIPKQENRKVCSCKRSYINPLSGICSLCWNEKYPNEKEEIKEEDLLEPKQETIEEAAERLYPTTIDSFTDTGIDRSEGDRAIFIEGTKWQAERMYSEEDMKDYSNYISAHNQSNKWELPLAPKQWFEQFKKK